jgi:hypothetical protein
MDKIINYPPLAEIERNISITIKRVLERGFDNIEESIEDYSQLIEKAEYRNAIILELYENYFPAKRHEFELQIITDIVNAVVQSKIAIFVAGAALSGPIGDLTTLVLKKTLNLIVDAFSSSEIEKEKFNTILDDVKKIEEYFLNKDSEESNKLSRKTGIETDRLIPLLKLLGYKKYKKGKKKYWKK